MIKSLQRISAMASAFVITLTTTLALAAGPRDWVKRTTDGLKDAAEDQVESFFLNLVTEPRLEDLVGRNWQQALILFVMTIALLMIFTKKWDRSQIRLAVHALIGYLLALAYALLYEGLHASIYEWAFSFSDAFFIPLPILLALGIWYQVDWFRNFKFAFNYKDALWAYLDPRKRQIPDIFTGDVLVPSTVDGPQLPGVPLDTPSPETPTEPGQPDDTTDTPDSKPPPDPDALRRPKPEKEMQCKGCGAGTRVGSKFCENCGNDPLKAAIAKPSAAEEAGPTVVCPKGHTTPDAPFCEKCGEPLKPAAPTRVGLRKVRSKR